MGEIVGDAAHGDPNVSLSKYGEIAKEYLYNINSSYENVQLDCFCIMPNHIHCVIIINKRSPRAAPPTIPKIVNAFKGLSAKKTETDLWQRGFYEHIIRNEQELTEIREYILNNPLKWELDKYFN